MSEASSHALDLTARLRELEASLTESRSRESRLQRDSQENKLRQREAAREVAHLTGT